MHSWITNTRFNYLQTTYCASQDVIVFCTPKLCSIWLRFMSSGKKYGKISRRESQFTQFMIHPFSTKLAHICVLSACIFKTFRPHQGDESPCWWRQHVPLKRRSTIILHGSTSQKTNLNFILAAVRTWNLTWTKSYPNPTLDPPRYLLGLCYDLPQHDICGRNTVRATWMLDRRLSNALYSVIITATRKHYVQSLKPKLITFKNSIPQRKHIALHLQGRTGICCLRKYCLFTLRTIRYATHKQCYWFFKQMAHIVTTGLQRR
jgi:hypothetical protein